MKEGDERNQMSTTFDTYAAVKNLERAGFQETQAEAVVRTVGEAIDDQVATKADLVTLRAEIKADMQANSAALKADMQANSAALKADVQANSAALKADVQGDLFKAALAIVGLTSGLTVALTVALLNWLIPSVAPPSP